MVHGQETEGAYTLDDVDVDVRCPNMSAGVFKFCSLLREGCVHFFEGAVDRRTEMDVNEMELQAQRRWRQDIKRMSTQTPSRMRTHKHTYHWIRSMVVTVAWHKTCTSLKDRHNKVQFLICPHTQLTKQNEINMKTTKLLGAIFSTECCPLLAVTCSWSEGCTDQDPGSLPNITRKPVEMNPRSSREAVLRDVSTSRQGGGKGQGHLGCFNVVKGS